MDVEVLKEWPIKWLRGMHVGKAALWGILAALGLAALYPVFFLICGSFLGKD